MLEREEDMMEVVVLVLAQRPFTLVLTMINSCSYSLLMILCLINFRFLIKILVGVWLQQKSFKTNMLIQELARQDLI